MFTVEEAAYIAKTIATHLEALDYAMAQVRPLINIAEQMKNAFPNITANPEAMAKYELMLQEVAKKEAEVADAHRWGDSILAKLRAKTEPQA